MSQFARRVRLSNKRDFQKVFATGNKITGKYLFALYRHNDIPYARLGIIIAKHYLRLSTQRNQVRRIIRESFRQQYVTLKGLDIVVLMRSKWSTLEKNALRDDIYKIWQILAQNGKKASSN